MEVEFRGKFIEFFFGLKNRETLDLMKNVSDRNRIVSISEKFPIIVILTMLYEKLIKVTLHISFILKTNKSLLMKLTVPLFHEK